MLYSVRLHTHYMYLSTYSLHVLVYILTTCTCLHTHYMYLSTGGQSSCVNVPIKDQLTVYGELMIFTMTWCCLLMFTMKWCLLMFSWHPLHSNRSDSIRYWIASCLEEAFAMGTSHQPWCPFCWSEILSKGSRFRRSQSSKNMEEWAM